MEIKVSWTRPTGRSKKAWMKNIEQDMCKWNLVEKDVHECDRWRELLKIQNQ